MEQSRFGALTKTTLVALPHAMQYTNSSDRFYFAALLLSS